MSVLRHSTCCCHRTTYIRDALLPSLYSLSLLLFPATNPCICVFSCRLRVILRENSSTEYRLISCLTIKCLTFRDLHYFLNIFTQYTVPVFTLSSTVSRTTKYYYSVTRHANKTNFPSLTSYMSTLSYVSTTQQIQ